MGARGQPARRGGARRPGDDARRARARQPARGAGAGGSGRGAVPGRAAPGRPGRARLLRSRPTARRDRGPRMGGPRRGGRVRAAAPLIVYGRNPVREALRGRRAVHEVWATPRAARLEWLARVDLTVVDEHALTQRAGSPEHQGVAARADPYAYADPGNLLAAPDPLLVALDQVAARRRSPRRGARPPLAGSSTCRWGACATWPTSWPPPRRPAAGATARRRTPRRPTT